MNEEHPQNDDKNIVFDAEHENYYLTRSLIFRNRAAMARLRERYLRKYYDLTTVQSDILWLVYRSTEPLSPQILANRFFRSQNTLSLNLKRMIDKGLIYYEKDPRGKNRVQVRLTDKSYEILKETLELDDEKLYKNIFTTLSDEEHKHLQSLLTRLLEETGRQLHINVEWFIPAEQEEKKHHKK